MAKILKGKKVKSKKRIAVTDEEFVRRLLLLDGRQSDLARELGITPGAVSQRVTKLAELIKSAREASDGSAVAGLVARSIPHKGTQAVRAEAFNSGIESVGRQYHIFDHLEDLFLDIKSLLDYVKKDIDDTKAKNRPIKPFHIDQVVKLVNQSRTLITDAHKIKMDLEQAGKVESFVGALLAVILRYDPQIREKLYVELSGLGMEGQVALFMAGERPSGRSDGNS